MTPTDTPKADQPEPGEAAMEAAAKMKQGIANLSKHRQVDWAAAIIQRAINAAVKPVEAERDQFERELDSALGLAEASTSALGEAEQERDAARAERDTARAMQKIHEEQRDAARDDLAQANEIIHRNLEIGTATEALLRETAEERDAARAAARELAGDAESWRQEFCEERCSKLDNGEHWEECRTTTELHAKHAALLAEPDLSKGEGGG